jgi:hypothetical protein
MILLTPIKIAVGEPFSFAFTVTGQDWTGYTGTVLYKKAPQGDLILEDTCTGDALGEVTFALTAAETALVPAFDVLGYRKTGVYQVRLVNGADVQTFQGDMLTASAV